MPHSRLPPFLYAAVAGAGVLALIVLAVYFSSFHGPLGTQEVLGQFGDYVGGLLNPILSFVTLMTLLWSLHVQGSQLAASHQALQQAQALHREQLAIQREESVRNQLKQDAELYLNECARLSARPVFRISTFDRPLGEPVSLDDLYKNPRYFGVESAASTLSKIPGYLSGSDALALHLNSLRTSVSSAVFSVCNLIQYTEVPALRTSWERRCLTLITDVRGVQVLSETEAGELKLALLGALTLAAERYTPKSDALSSTAAAA